MVPPPEAYAASVGHIVAGEMRSMVSEISRLAGQIQAQSSERDLLYTDLRRLVPGFSQGTPLVTVTPAVSCPAPAMAAATTAGSTARASSATTAVGAFVGTGLEDGESGSEEVEESDSDSSTMVSEVPMEDHRPNGKVERDSFTEAMRLISPASFALVAKTSTGEIDNFLPVPRSGAGTVKWATPRFARDGVDRLTAKLQGLMSANAAPYRDRSLLVPQMEHFRASNVLPVEDFRLKLSEESLFQAKPACQDTFFPDVDVPATYTVSAQWFKDTQELCQRAQIACGQALAGAGAAITMVSDAVVDLGSVLPHFRPTQHVYMTALMVAQKEAAAAAANFELVRRDHVLHKVGLPREDARRVRTVALGSKDLFGPDTKDFVAWLNEESREAKLGCGGKFLHGLTAFKPKIMQTPKPKGAAFTGSTKKLPFRESGQGSANPGQGSAPVPTYGASAGFASKSAKRRTKQKSKAKPFPSKGKPAAAGKPSA